MEIYSGVVFSNNTTVYIDRFEDPTGKDREKDSWGAGEVIYLDDPRHPNYESTTTQGGGNNNGGAVIPQPTTQAPTERPTQQPTQGTTEATTEVTTEEKTETTTQRVTETTTETTTRNNFNQGVIIGGGNSNNNTNSNNTNNSVIIDTDRNTNTNNIGLIGDNDILNPIIEDVDVIGDGELGEGEELLLNDEIREENILATRNMLNNSSKGLLTDKNNDLANEDNEEISKTKTDKPAFGFANSTMSWLIVLLILLILIIIATYIIKKKLSEKGLEKEEE